MSSYGKRLRRTLPMACCLAGLGWSLHQSTLASDPEHLAMANVKRAVAPHERRCQCGRWTCPICQSECDCLLKPLPCPPGALPSWSTPPYAPEPWLPDGRTEAIPLSPPSSKSPDKPLSPDNRSEQAPPSGAGQGSSRTTSPPTGLAPNDPLNSGGPTRDGDLNAVTPPIGGLAATLGIGAGAAGVPNMVGDYFGGGTGSALVTQIYPVTISAQGFLVPSNQNTAIAFEAGSDTFPNDFFSVGDGTSSTGDGPIDTFAISEPVPPSDAPVSPRPGATFQGGTAVHPTGNIVDGDTWLVNYSFGEARTIVLPSPGTGGVVVGRLKIAENASPIPRNRIFLNYSMFDNVPLVAGGVTVNRMTPGFETTMLDQLISFELRAPMAVTLDNDIVLDGPGNLNSWEFGDLFLAVKGLLIQTDKCALSAGLSVALPTAKDLHVGLADGTRLVSVRNQSTHLMPFVGGLINVRDGYFMQGFVQIDIDANGNSIDANRNGQGLEPIGRNQDPTLMYLDVGLGRVIPVARRRGSKIAPML